MHKDNIKLKIKGEILFNEPMSRHTSFKVGGPADILVFPHDEDDIINILQYACNNNISWCVLGRGSNVLVKDKGITGIVIKTERILNTIDIHNNIFEVSAGILLPKLVRFTQEMEFGGLEFAIGIPGNVGGAVAMNAGVKDKCIGDLVLRIWGVSGGGEKKEWKKEELDFGYRKSIFSESGDIITKAELLLKKDSPQDIKERIDGYIKKRKETQPLEYHSAGSIFKNPGNGKFAAALIDKSGCKGLQIGSMRVSEKHAGFIINVDPDKAKAFDVLSLIKEIQKRVYNKFGVNLEPEIKVLGE
ncbi:MAG: UDP-N-acetylmuramate dehydrogenase [bacterium]|nr:UDP-N-acetylmuramate dehydrogenase [bacterium]